MAGSSIKKTTAGALAYVLGPITGIIFLVIDKDPFVRFHAVQSTVVFIVLMVLQWIFGITVILFPLAAIVGILEFILWLVCIYKAWQGEQWEVPILGKFAKQISKKV
jgi:uncharacterized membrane protein